MAKKSVPLGSVREAPKAWAEWLGVSLEAVELYTQSDVIDLHLDSFIWARVFGYDLRQRHEPGLLSRWFWGHADLPRAIDAGLTGATWVITTNPFRIGSERSDAFRSNLASLTELLQTYPGNAVQLVRTHADYQDARRAGRHAAFVGIQGGNAVDVDLSALDALGPQTVLRITLLHLTRSTLGAPAGPWPWHQGSGLTALGRQYVEALNERRIFVDLAHINRKGFYDVCEVHDRTQPLIVTHTGVSGVFRHWRNLDDDQLRRVADTGGTIGILYHAPYLGGGWFGGTASTVFRHIQHVVETVGEDYVSLGSDWDGAIVAPSDLRSCSDLPRLVQIMLDHGWSSLRIQKVLGLNFLRALKQLRG